MVFVEFDLFLVYVSRLFIFDCYQFQNTVIIGIQFYRLNQLQM